MRRDLDKIWDELLLKAHGNRIDLVENPAEQEKPAAKLLDWLKGSENIEPEMLKIAFIYPKTKESSGWVYAHELGRMYLEQKYEGKLQTVVFNNASTDSQVAAEYISGCGFRLQCDFHYISSDGGSECKGSSGKSSDSSI